MNDLMAKERDRRDRLHDLCAVALVLAVAVLVAFAMPASARAQTPNAGRPVGSAAASADVGALVMASGQAPTKRWTPP